MLLFDENLSRALVSRLAPEFPGAEHVVAAGLASADDFLVWQYAKDRGLTIVSKDSDFVSRVTLRGPPPRLVLLRVGNASTRQITDLLRAHADQIRGFHTGTDNSVLLLS
jgi:predicted nuclease of predicted toxin-antitoxin system